MRRNALVVVPLFLAMTGDAEAQPVSNPAPPPGHESVALGMALGYGAQGGGRAGTEGGAEQIELFAGWAFQRVAVMGWLRGRVRKGEAGFYDLGGAARFWPLAGTPWLYGELRGGRTAYSLSGDGDNLKGHGVIFGGGVGLELLSRPKNTVDVRAMLDRGIFADVDDYTLFSFALALHFY
jgi:hypothetical protein